MVLFATFTLFCPGGFGKVGKRGREYVAFRFGSVGPLLVQRTHKVLRVGHGGGLEFLEGFEVALALLALQLEQRYGGAQGYRIGVFALGYGHGRRLLPEGRDGRWHDTWAGLGGLQRG